VKRYAVDVLVGIVLTWVLSTGCWAVGIEREYRSNIKSGFPAHPSPLFVCRQCLPGQFDCD
jgi:hypothetical protein